jgi:hypothetical protein
MTPLEDQLYRALVLTPCRCQMAGGPKWHLRAKPEVAKLCSRCAAVTAYEAPASDGEVNGK